MVFKAILETHLEQNAPKNANMGEKHEEKCDVCDERFAGSTKLKTHICRVHVTNPTYGSLCVKKWYINHECIRVFCEKSKKHIAWLHSKQCLKIKPCPDRPKEILPGEIAKDKTNILHIWGYTFEVSDIHTIDWQILNHYIYISDHVEIAD